MTVLLGTLLSSIKKIEAPDVFDWEIAIALHAMQGNRPSSHGEVEVSWVFSSCGTAGTWDIFSSYDVDAHSKWDFV